MTLQGVSELQRRVRGLKNHFRAKAVILLYHRVADLKTDPQLLNVSPQNFSRHLECLARDYTVVSLRDLADASAGQSRLSDRTVAITFDDGYADNLVNAKPVLTQFHLPATVFVTTGNLDHSQEFWWDELERIFLHPSTLPPRLCLQIGGRVLEYDLADAARYTERDAERHRTWNVVGRDNPTIRHKIYRDICALLRPSTVSERAIAMQTLRDSSGAQASARETYRCLTSDELKGLGSGPLIEVGAHSVSHSVLASLPVSEQRTEILESREQLARILGEAPHSFAYPYGTKSDYTVHTAALVREAGFSTACANVPGVVTQGEDVYQLPRFVVRDWGKELFARQMEDWFKGRRTVEC